VSFNDPYTYDARVVEVIDGDTQDLEVDQGFNTRTVSRFRVKGVDTHETYGVPKESEEYQRGKAETRWVRDWLQDGSEQYRWPLRIRTFDEGKYGRWLVQIQRKSDTAVLNDDLLEEFDDIEYP
jgi:micrococcal nuclease